MNMAVVTEALPCAKTLLSMFEKNLSLPSDIAMLEQRHSPHSSNRSDICSSDRCSVSTAVMVLISFKSFCVNTTEWIIWTIDQHNNDK